MILANANAKKKILVLAPFFEDRGSWIDDFCDRLDLEFHKAAYPKRLLSWHSRGMVTPMTEWLGHFFYVHQAMKWKPDCIVTSFPQLALVAAAQLCFFRKPGPSLVAWNFNLGSLASSWKGYLSGRPLSRVDQFIVHARGEVGSYARWLGIAEDKFRFVPLQRGKIVEVSPSPIQRPYIVSMGSANRDYRVLVEAVIGTGIKTVIISKKEVIDQLPNHPGLVKLSGLSLEECNSILGGAELNVVPMKSTKTASGQVTFLTSMRMGIPSVVTRCVGSVDYINDGLTGLLVAPEQTEALRQAILALWQDVDLKSRIGLAGRLYAEQHFSDEAAGRYLSQTLDEVLAR